MNKHATNVGISTCCVFSLFVSVHWTLPGHGRSATRCLLYRIMTKKQLAAQFQGSFSCNLHFIMSPAVWLVKKTTRWPLAGLVRIIETWLRSRSNWSNGDRDHANLRTLTLLPSCHTHSGQGANTRYEYYQTLHHIYLELINDLEVSVK